jgi:hypothetical protein
MSNASLAGPRLIKMFVCHCGKTIECEPGARPEDAPTCCHIRMLTITHRDGDESRPIEIESTFRDPRV